VEPGVPVVEFDHPERSSRLLIFVRGILAIPHIIVLYLGAIGLLFAMLFAWFAILFTGRYPKGLWSFVVGYERYRLRVSAYLILLTDKYPPFSFEDAPDYPVRLLMERPERTHRWRILFSFLVAIPALLVAEVWTLAAFLLTVVAWFAILIAGRYPKGLFGFNTGALRLATTVNVYVTWTSSKYPL
jgi:hypothetical protein